jgi:hypothetical protein
MNQSQLFNVLVSSDVPELERESLILSLSSVADVQEAPSRISGPEWITFVAIMKDVATVAGAAAALVKLGNEINTWRRNARQCAIEPKVKLQGPDQAPLELTTATDEEVEKWLSQNKP